MCVVSMIGDHYTERWQGQWPTIVQPWTLPSFVTRDEYEALREDVEELKVLLQRAKKYDEEHGEPDCEVEEKVALLRKVAKLVGVELDALR